MSLQYLSVPFKTDEVYSGFAELNGIMHVTEAGLKLEFQVKDSILGVLKSKAKSMLIPFHELGEVQYRKNFFVSKF